MATIGPVAFTTFTSAAPGTDAWSSPSNAASSDNSRASFTDDDNGGSQTLKATGADLSAIPNGAVINSITMTKEHSASESSSSGGGRRITDQAIYLVVGGSEVGTNKAKTGSSNRWPLVASETDSDYLWDSSDITALGGLLGSDIKTNFGFVVRAEGNRNDGSEDGYVDYMYIKEIDYTVPASSSSAGGGISFVG